jgi:hypothetical protein
MAWYFCPILTKFQFSSQNGNTIYQYNMSQKSVPWEMSFTRTYKLTGIRDEANTRSPPPPATLVFF